MQTGHHADRQGTMQADKAPCRQTRHHAGRQGTMQADKAPGRQTRHHADKPPGSMQNQREKALVQSRK